MTILIHIKNENIYIDCVLNQSHNTNKNKIEAVDKIFTDYYPFSPLNNIHHFYSPFSFFIPHPNASPMEFRIENRSYVFTSDDFHVSFAPFLKPLRSDLQMNRAAVETNR